MFEPPPKKLRIDVLQTQNWTKMNTLMQTDVRFTGRMSQKVPDERSFQIRTKLKLVIYLLLIRN